MIRSGLHTTHLAFELEREEDLFSLGYKVLQKQPVFNAISGLHIKYNRKVRLLYSVENLLPVAAVVESLSEAEKIQMLTDLLEAIRQTTENGFLPKEAVVVDSNCLFWNAEKRELRLVVLPIQMEQKFEDGLSWVNRLRKSLIYLSGFLKNNQKERLCAYFESMDAVPSELDLTIRELKAVKAQNAGNAMEGHREDAFLSELVLYSNQDYGNVRIHVDKPEFILGKKQESVDGYLGSSSSVSRMHCKILNRQNRYFCMDLGSLNHTYVNGVMIAPGEKLELHDKDILRLADIELQVQLTVAGGNG